MAGAQKKSKYPKAPIVKTTKVPKPVTEDGLRDRTKTDMRAYHRVIDWAEWWEEFYLAVKENGTPKYKSYRSFAKAKATNDLQRDFIEYIIGPPGIFESVPPSWETYKPMDWDEKRESGGWYSDKSLQKLTSEVQKHATALEALAEIGHKFTLRSLMRFERLAQQLDAEFKGRFFVDGLSYGENLQRADKYLQLHKEILRLQSDAQDMYARAHGVNYSIDGFQTLLMGMRMTSGDNPEQNRVGKVVNKIIEMTLTKSTTHDVPLPESMTNAIVAIDQPKKSKVN